MSKETLTTTLFIDIETVGQKKTYDELDADWKKLWDAQFFRDEEVASLPPADRYLRKAALKAEFAKVVCVSMGVVIFKQTPGAEAGTVVEEPTLYIKSFTGDEKDILKKFSDATEKYSRLGAHNGKSFDFPFLTRRLIINGMPVPKILDNRGKKPWEVDSIDTQEMWRFGDAVYPSLDLLAKTFGVSAGLGEGKASLLDGSEIHDLFYGNRPGFGLDEIAHKCSNDVAKLVRVYVKMNAPKLDITKITAV